MTVKRSAAKSQEVKTPAPNPPVERPHALSAKSQKVETLAPNLPAGGIVLPSVPYFPDGVIVLSSVPPAKPAQAGGWSASSVLVIGKTKVVDAAYKQAEERILRSVANRPSIPLKADVSVHTLQGEELPAPTRRALQGALWSLQRRFHLDTGGPSHVDFYDHAGFTFMVVYLP